MEGADIKKDKEKRKEHFEQFLWRHLGNMN